MLSLVIVQNSHAARAAVLADRAAGLRVQDLLKRLQRCDELVQLLTDALVDAGVRDEDAPGVDVVAVFQSPGFT